MKQIIDVIMNVIYVIMSVILIRIGLCPIWRLTKPPLLLDVFLFVPKQITYNITSVRNKKHDLWYN